MNKRDRHSNNHHSNSNPHRKYHNHRDRSSRSSSRKKQSNRHRNKLPAHPYNVKDSSVNYRADRDSRNNGGNSGYQNRNKYTNRNNKFGKFNSSHAANKLLKNQMMFMGKDGVFRHNGQRNLLEDMGSGIKQQLKRQNMYQKSGKGRIR